METKIISVSVVLMTVMVLVLASLVSAAPNSHAASTAAAKAASPSPMSSAVSSAVSSAQATASQRLTAVKLRVCQTKQATIQTRDRQLTQLATNMQATFGNIASRVETYYTGQIVSSGKTLSNYNTLLADITAKQAAVQTQLSKASADASLFSCGSDNPKGQLTQYRTDMQTVKQALQDYRTSIKNLIVAINTLVGTSTSSPTASVSATPTTNPSPTATQ